MNEIIKFTMGGLDPPIQTFKRWMAGSETGHGEAVVRNFEPRSS